MNDDFATALRRSLSHVRAGDPVEATRQIQAALRPGVGGASGAEAATPRHAGTASPRQRLSQVIAGLARRPPGFNRSPRGCEPDVPAGAVFDRRCHTGPHGSREYRLYRPSNRDAPIRGVVLMLHGCTQAPEVFAVGTGMNQQAEQHRLVIAYPEQTRSHNASLCWNWFRPADQGRSGGEPALLAGLAAEVAAEHGVPPSSVFVSGLSAGGAMAAILAQTHPDVFAAAGVHSGLAPGSAQDVISAFGAMRGDPAPRAAAVRAPVIIFHGSADATVAPVNAGRLAGPLEDTREHSGERAGRRYDVLAATNASGHPVEVWRIDGAGHAWSGGDPRGSYADPAGPDASAEMVRFFLSLG